MRANIIFPILFSALLLALAGCGGSGDKLDLDLSASCGEGHVRQTDGSCIKICPEGQYDVEDVCTDIPRENADTTDGPPTSTSKPTKVKIKSTNVITGCVFQVSRCGGDITASGGSKSYTWKVLEGDLSSIGLSVKFPSAADKNTSKASIIGQPTKMTGLNNPVTIKIDVEDAKDASKHAEVSFSFTVTDKLNISLYQALPPDAESLRLIGDRSDALELEYKVILQATVVGKSTEYTWGIDAKNVKCYKDADVKNQDECKGDISGKLIQTSKIGNLTIPTSTYIMPAKNDYEGYRFENLVITVANKTGDKKTITIPSVVFKKDPCSQPLVITSDDFGGVKDVNRSASLNSNIADVIFRVKGGKGPYTWSGHLAAAQGAIEFDAQTENAEGADDFTVSGSIAPTKDLTLRQYVDKQKIQYLVDVSDDGCKNQAAAHGSINIAIDPVASIMRVEDLRVSLTAGGRKVVSFWHDAVKVGRTTKDDANCNKTDNWCPIVLENGMFGKTIDYINRIAIQDSQLDGDDVTKIEIFTDYWIAKGVGDIANQDVRNELLPFMDGYSAHKDPLEIWRSNVK